MSELLPAIEAAFESHFGHAPRHVTRAPGRVNLIGEHTDYNGGFVMPCAIGFHTLVAVSPRADDTVEALAVDWQGETDRFSLREDIAFEPTKMWANYIRGVVKELQQRGFKPTGCNIAMTGNVPPGAGLSSSAALEIGVIQALATLRGFSMDATAMAQVGQAAENDFVGCNCGIMDQLISAAGREGYAMLIDCRSLALTPLRIPDSLSLLIVNSNVQRGLVDSEYNLRRQQCDDAAKAFGCDSLRDVSLDTFAAGREQLPADVARRAQHVLEENQRVLDLQAAFEREDIAAISALMAGSHASMRTLFGITTPEIDLLVDIINDVVGSRGGARMTGGGFGGCVVALLPHDLVDETEAAIADTYKQKTGLQERVYRTAPSAGVSVFY